MLMYLFIAGSFLFEIMALVFIKNQLLRRTSSVLSALLLLASITSMHIQKYEYDDLSLGIYIYISIASIVGLYKLVNLYKLFKGLIVYQKLYHSCLRATSYLTLAFVGMLLGIEFNVGLTALLLSLIAAVVSMLLLIQTIYSNKAFTPPQTTHYLTNTTAPSVSVLIPARDETEELLDCLDSVVESDYPKLEILVLDDCSQNKRTAEIIKEFAGKGVRFIAGSNPEDTWLGKNNAYELLRQQATGEYLIFMGTDIRIDKNTIKNVLDRIHDTHLDMVSVIPQRAVVSELALSAPLRYFWEFSLPRKLMRRPPVLSSFWVIRSKQLQKFGGFKGVSRSIIPERHLARFNSSHYAFWKSNQSDLHITSTKSLNQQTQTALLHRYPQAKRRVERSAFFSISLLVTVLTPYLLISVYPFMSAISILCVMIAIGISEQTVRKTCVLRALLALPLVVHEVYIMNVSMIRYEFGRMYWKGRNVCMPVMRVYKSLPNLTD